MKILTFLVPIIFLSVTGYSQSLNDSLILYMPLDGNAIDISGNGLNGSNNATTTTDRFGNVNGAVSFNGVTEYIDFPNDASLKPDLPVTISFWAKVDDVTDGNTTMFFDNDFSQNNYHGIFVKLANNGSGVVSVSFGDGSGTTGPTSRRTGLGSIPLSNNTWHHITVVVRGATDMDIWVDCARDKSVTYSGSGGNLAYSVDPGSLGRHDSHVSLPPYYYSGALDELRFYNRELQSSEIAQLCDISAGTGDQENLAGKVAVYPNPSNSTITIDSKNNAQALEILNVMGQEILEINENLNAPIDVSSLSPGTYFIRVLTVQGQWIYASFVKQ